ncbi:Subtilisin-like protease SBT3.18 [Sesamum alatum]|uniref:Subtilisin-like protease SBT3.18 n=1 Tax=Sesamum alatum TaxID=300844 RepID=A0AAE1Z2I3_9LAMI|nr:Subtilisin-like protease SBT3.18 [Sesamum alatum]
MANAFRSFWGISLSFLLHFILSVSSTHVISSSVYIVYLGRVRNHDPVLTSGRHLQLLTSVFQSEEEAKDAMIYSYKHVLSGFAAILNESQAIILANTKGVISVFESKTLELHTTRSWDFMGLNVDQHKRFPLQLAYGDDIIVGLFDSGVWPESASFMEEPGMGPVPKHWKGKCVPGEEFNPKKACNRKLIGAKYYLTGYERRFGKINNTRTREYVSARDVLGHGTHTASTAVGSRAKDASYSGLARGTARGGAPRARLAVYKICWNSNFGGTCTEEDALAAFDEALHDGVHVISASFGKGPPLRQFFASSSDIGSFHAMQLGVSVVFSAGNNGPDPSLVGNVNPWSICVAASTVDRSFPTKILLEDGSFFVGEGLITNHISGNLSKARNYFLGGICSTSNWKNASASGNVLLCFSTDGPVSSNEAEFAARVAKAAAVIFVEPLTRPIASVSIFPVIRIDIIQGMKLLSLPNSTKVQILPSKTEFSRSPAPMVADFSSRGPSSISPDFLKPDITAPGVNILAAWPPNIPPSMFPDDERQVHWNFLSGTSMSCPHVSGVVALLKSAHPNWSPAAIRSALMTTAYTKDINGDDISVEATTKPSDPFDVGAGHINPVQAFDPGLVYDMTTRDYVLFLCNIGYTEEQIQAIVSCPSTTCPDRTEPNWSMNYPSITVSSLTCTTTIKRTVRNVGHMKTAMYFASIVSPNGVEVVVWPRILMFTPFKEEMTYFVTLKPVKMSEGRYDFGWISWSDGFHQVRSPLVVQVNTTGVEGSNNVVAY